MFVMLSRVKLDVGANTMTMEILSHPRHLPSQGSAASTYTTFGLRTDYGVASFRNCRTIADGAAVVV